MTLAVALGGAGVNGGDGAWASAASSGAAGYHAGRWWWCQWAVSDASGVVRALVLVVLAAVVMVNTACPSTANCRNDYCWCCKYRWRWWRVWRILITISGPMDGAAGGSGIIVIIAYPVGSVSSSNSNKLVRLLSYEPVQAMSLLQIYWNMGRITL
jgi:hypothetical protein